MCSLPPVPANRAAVNIGDAIDLNLLQMMQVARKYKPYVRLCLSKHLVQIRGVVRQERSRSFEIWPVGLSFAADTEIGQHGNRWDVTTQDGRRLGVCP